MLTLKFSMRQASFGRTIPRAGKITGRTGKIVVGKRKPTDGKITGSGGLDVIGKRKPRDGEIMVVDMVDMVVDTIIVNGRRLKGCAIPFGNAVGRAVNVAPTNPPKMKSSTHKTLNLLL